MLATAKKALMPLLLSATVTVFETVFTAFTVFVIGYFWIAERTVIRRLVSRSVRPEQRTRILTIWEDVEARLGAWVRGQLLLMLIIGAAQGIGYAVLGLPFALLLAAERSVVNVGSPFHAVFDPAALLQALQDVLFGLAQPGPLALHR